MPKTSVPAFGPKGKKSRRNCLGQADLFPVPASAVVSSARPASAQSTSGPYYTLLTAQRAGQKMPVFRARYRRRSGIEATFSHLVNAHRTRRMPYCGSAKTLCYYSALAVEVNLRRVALWEAGQRPQRERRLYLSRLLASQNAKNRNAENQMDGPC